jgi:hypothetical protein
VSQYKKLDDLIVDRVATKGIQFTPLFSANAVREESQRLGTLLGREPFRVLDGRLQALKRKGVITYGTKTGWVKSEFQQATTATIGRNESNSRAPS